MKGPDPAPLPYGGLQYYQVHYIVELPGNENDELLARCQPITEGHFGQKRVTGVKWTGAGRFAERLQQDSKLTEMLRKVMPIVGEIRIDPQDEHVRIYGKWVHQDRIDFNETMFEIADRIAMHLKERS